MSGPTKRVLLYADVPGDFTEEQIENILEGVELFRINVADMSGFIKEGSGGPVIGN